MGELVSLQDFHTFREAAERAKALAIESESQTGVRRSESGWSVLASPKAARLESKLSDDRQEEMNDVTDVQLDYQREVLEPLLDDLEDDRDNWARSAKGVRFIFPAAGSRWPGRRCAGMRGGTRAVAALHAV